MSESRSTSFLRRTRWSPYLVGAAIGALSWVTFGVMDKALGASTTFVRASGSLVGLASEAHVRETPYYAKYLVGKSAFDWQFALVVMLIVGAFVGHFVFGRERAPGLPASFVARFGASPLRRYVFAFVGGAIMLFGARFAGGCTSGHALSGGMQLAVSSWVFFAAMFVTGVVTARLVFGRGAN